MQARRLFARPVAAFRELNAETVTAILLAGTIAGVLP